MGADTQQPVEPQREPKTPSAWWILVRTVVTLVLVVVAYYVLPDDVKDASAAARVVGFALCVLALAGLILFLILRHDAGGVPARAEGLLLTVVVSLAFFATVYYRLAQIKGQFNGLDTRTDGLYFTLVTTATVGYGDINAAGQAARIVVMVHIVFNLVFLGAGVSVAMERIKQRRQGLH
ncbi:potassium channel family protein [Yinghuangia seranimata]|uniref:potassium channel family protein n=1 Tax=Yinghuangia seranimata TaxID=408067 RepID=UPI00248AF896|nr:potassium channel family protein [Yinghuangia seranimata]MDI2129973.1 potassium channel family protein [Yinghuangia seranimata]